MLLEKDAKALNDVRKTYVECSWVKEGKGIECYWNDIKCSWIRETKALNAPGDWDPKLTAFSRLSC